MIFHAGASNGDAPVWKIVSPEARLMETLGACNERLLIIFSFKIFVISAYTAVKIVISDAFPYL